MYISNNLDQVGFKPTTSCFLCDRSTTKVSYQSDFITYGANWQLRCTLQWDITRSMHQCGWIQFTSQFIVILSLFLQSKLCKGTELPVQVLVLELRYLQFLCSCV